MIEIKKSCSKSAQNREWADGIIAVMQDTRLFSKPKQLYRCSASVLFSDRFILLRSYATPIAIYDCYDNTLYDLLRIAYGYTSTSNQHIHKFLKWLAENNYPVNLFMRFTN